MTQIAARINSSAALVKNGIVDDNNLKVKDPRTSLVVGATRN